MKNPIFFPADLILGARYIYAFLAVFPWFVKVNIGLPANIWSHTAAEPGRFLYLSGTSPIHEHSWVVEHLDSTFLTCARQQWALPTIYLPPPFVILINIFLKVLIYSSNSAAKQQLKRFHSTFGIHYLVLSIPIRTVLSLCVSNPDRDVIVWIIYVLDQRWMLVKQWDAGLMTG